MNRQIKFRFWDGREYLDSNKFFIQAGRAYQFLDFGGVKQIGGILEQFTGLKDSAATDIYEGDIVKYSSYTQKYKSVVVFNRGGFIGKCFSCRSEDGYHFFPSDGANYTIDSFNAGWYYSNMSLIDWNETEVIGNINQNPELITNK